MQDAVGAPPAASCSAVAIEGDGRSGSHRDSNTADFLILNGRLM